ncbi:protein of unknown function [uncultured Sphingopyxis sp.]|uniref:Uncharacterized protein n=1 Tax=uncultured Sphingopyxis sp. TaxID=310581 RepID=A0A1Y5Q135_9SPHN|nr:protein of unknown function [uncultured Sphingopyxis sp.]
MMRLRSRARNHPVQILLDLIPARPPAPGIALFSNVSGNLVQLAEARVHDVRADFDAPIIHLCPRDVSARGNTIDEPVIYTKELELIGNVAADCVAKIEGASAVGREGSTDKVGDLFCAMSRHKHPDIVRPDEYRTFLEDSGAAKDVRHH